MEKVINGKLYRTGTATELANNEFQDNTNRMNCGRCTTLYKTKKGAFFAYHETCWQGEADSIEPLDKAAAKELYEDLRNQSVDWSEAFSEVPEEA